jgi:hypothetical protein
MTAKDRKYGGRTITLPQGVAERLEVFRGKLREELGWKVSFAQAIAIALQRASEKGPEKQ